MIIWKDFILDDVVGPILAMPEEMQRELTKGSRKEERLGRPDAMKGARGKKCEVERSSETHVQVLSTTIQETRQEIQPARMVGSSSHDSAQVDRMLAGRDQVTSEMRLVGGEV